MRPGGSREGAGAGRQGRRDEVQPHAPEHGPAHGRTGDVTEQPAGPTTDHPGAGSRTATMAWLQRTAGNAAVAALLQASRAGSAVDAGPVSLRPTVQRDKKKAPAKPPPSTDPPQQQLAGIQGHAMDALLPELAALEPEVRGDEALGLAVGSTRLVMAMQTVAAKYGKTPWATFLSAKKTDFMTSWPPDQVGSILRYLGAPTEAAAMQALVVSELPDIVTNTQGDLPLTEKGRRDLIRTTVGEMAKRELGYGSTTPLVQDVRQRVLVALYMRSTQQGKVTDKGVAKGFSYPDREGDGTKGTKGKVNDTATAYWGARNDSGRSYSFPLSPAGQDNGYAAITSLFTPQVDPKARTLIHCDYLVSVLEYRAWAETIGIELFNKNVKLGNIPLVLRFDGFAELSHEIKISDGTNVTPMQPLVAVTLTSESDMVVGDHVVFYNDPTYDALTEGDRDVWRLENAIVVGADKGGLLFQGHGYSIPVPKSVLMDAMCAKYNLHVDRALALIKAEKAAKGQAAKDAAKAARVAKYPNVVRKSSGGWEVRGQSDITEKIEHHDLVHLTPATAPGLHHPKDGTLIARRPDHG